LCLHIERMRNGDQFRRRSFGYIEFETMTHIEYTVHFLPGGSAHSLDRLEKRWNREQVVLYDAQSINKMQHLGLCTSAAMDHAVDLRTHCIEHSSYNRSIGPCW